MKYAIRILLIRDKETKRKQISERLKQIYSKSLVKEVHSFEDLKEVDNLSDFDAVICDFNFSNNNGIEVLFYVRETELTLPFIFTSDTVWEEATIDTLVLNGASDYVLSDDLKKLEFTVRREVNRYHHVRNTQLKLKSSEHRFRSIVQSINGIVREIDLNSLENVYVSPQSMNILGFPASDWLEYKHFWLEQVHPKDRNGILSKLNKIIENGGDHTIEYRMISSNGDIVWIREMLSIRNENGAAVSLDGLMIDITKEKEIEFQRDLALEGEQRRMKEQKCLWNITNLDEQTFTIDQLLHRALIHIPIGFQYPNSLGAKIQFGNEEYVTNNYDDSDISLTSHNLNMKGKALSVQVVYLDDEIAHYTESPFKKDEEHLLDTISDILAIKIEKKRSADDLKKHEQLLVNTYELAQLGRSI